MPDFTVDKLLNLSREIEEYDQVDQKEFFSALSACANKKMPKSSRQCIMKILKLPPHNPLDEFIKKHNAYVKSGKHEKSR